MGGSIYLKLKDLIEQLNQVLSFPKMSRLCHKNMV